MKRTLFVLSAAAAAALLSSCNKMDSPALASQEGPSMAKEIRFQVSDVDISTKVSEVTGLNSFNVLATTGNEGSESKKWDATASKSGNSYGTQKYWPSTDPSYHFYASNAAISFNQDGSTVEGSAAADLVCAYLAQPVHNASNTLNFIHPQARVGEVSVTAASGYTLSDVSTYMANVKESGKYNIRTSAWSDCRSTDKLNLTVGTNDKYIVPGSYVMYVTYTISKGDYSASFTKSGSVYVSQGKINSISVRIADEPAVGISFSVNVSPWEAKAVSLILP